MIRLESFAALEARRKAIFEARDALLGRQGIQRFDSGGQFGGGTMAAVFVNLDERLRELEDGAEASQHKDDIPLKDEIQKALDKTREKVLVEYFGREEGDEAYITIDGAQWSIPNWVVIDIPSLCPGIEYVNMGVLNRQRRVGDRNRPPRPFAAFVSPPSAYMISPAGKTLVDVQDKTDAGRVAHERGWDWSTYWHHQTAADAVSRANR